MKTKIIFAIVLANLFIGSIINKVNAQGNNFKLDGNNNGTASSKFGFTNNADLKIVTRDTVRAIFKKDGDVIIEKDLFVKGKINGIFNIDNIIAKYLSLDSAKVLQFKADNITVLDNMHIFGQLHVGNNSLTLGSIPDPFGPDQITSTNGVINFGNTNLPFSNIQVGIGTTTPFVNLPGIPGLEVNNDINLTGSVQNHGYRIGGDVVLQNPGTQNIFAGVGAGVSTTTGTDNAFLGFEAGNSTTWDNRNTAVGSEALRYNTLQDSNTAIGFNALFSIT